MTITEIDTPTTESDDQEAPKRTPRVVHPPVEIGPDGKLGGHLRDMLLGTLSDVLDDYEKVRIANNNRYRTMTGLTEDVDGYMRGHRYPEDAPPVIRLKQSIEAMKFAEDESIKNLQRVLRLHPLSPFQKRYRGLGEKQFARLLATIGDPYFNDKYNRPRTVSELWAYSGLHVVSHSEGSEAGIAPKRTRGKKSNWNENARKRAWVCAESLMKGGRKASDDKRGAQDEVADHFRITYDAARFKYADAVHQAPCVRCGPKGKPALEGSPLSDGHKHARGLRAVSKELLKLLWRESRAIYGITDELESAELAAEAAGLAANTVDSPSNFE
jgi:hypothetical protein